MRRNKKSQRNKTSKNLQLANLIKREDIFFLIKERRLYFVEQRNKNSLVCLLLTLPNIHADYSGYPFHSNLLEFNTPYLLYLFPSSPAQ